MLDRSTAAGLGESHSAAPVHRHSLNNQCELEGSGVVAGHGGCTNVAGRLWLMPTSSTEEEVVDLFCIRRPLWAVPTPAEHDIPGTNPGLRRCAPSPLSCEDSPSVQLTRMSGRIARSRTRS